MKEKCYKFLNTHMIRQTISIRLKKNIILVHDDSCAKLLLLYRRNIIEFFKIQVTLINTN